MILWHPKGMMLRRALRDFWEAEHLNHGYHLVQTPHIARGALWQTSGHLEYYAENMYVFEKDGEPYVVKPMNCPFHIHIYTAKPRSYRDLPIRYAEWGTVYRYERSGTLHGLFRTRGYTCDDAHIFCTPHQLEAEIARVVALTQRILGKLGFSEYDIELSTRDPTHPERYLGSAQAWTRSQRSLATVLDAKHLPYTEVPGEAAFYGPKIDLMIHDIAGRRWQCTTIQVDFNLPRRFNLTYTGSDGAEHRIVMLHRALLGSVGRFVGILLEHYQGALPTWLAPIQVRVLPLSEPFRHYAAAVHEHLCANGIRSDLDASAATLRYRIRDAETQKIPYMAICGRREADSQTIAVRKHGREALGSFTIPEFVDLIRKSYPLPI